MEFPTYELEEQAKAEGYKYIVGTDEAGRGALFGPVLAAAVHVPEESVPLLEGKVNDSKKVSPKRREEMYELIREHCNFGIQEISAEVIDDINILEATKLAMQSSIEQLEYFDYILIDGNVDLRKHVVCQQKQIIKGDAKSISIAAASIIAKVTRDRIMDELHTIFPIYGIDSSKGYGTKQHRDAIELYGPSMYHRLTFKRVKEFI